MIIDLHSHIIPHIDDGAADEDTSLDMLRMAVEEGITHMFATPHYIHGAINNNISIVNEKYLELKKAVKDNGIDINIYTGSEIFISPEVPHLVAERKVCTLNNSSYVLIELPMMNIPVYTDDVIYKLRLNGFIPIIAHPERNIEISKNPNILYNLIVRGVLCQVNGSSLRGIYGKKIRDTAMTLLRHGMIHFVGSDAHTCRGRSPKLKRSRGIVEAEMGHDFAKSIYETNGLAVISNEMIDIAEPERVKNWKGFLVPLFKKFGCNR